MSSSKKIDVFNNKNIKANLGKIRKKIKKYYPKWNESNGFEMLVFDIFDNNSKLKKELKKNYGTITKIKNEVIPHEGIISFDNDEGINEIDSVLKKILQGISAIEKGETTTKQTKQKKNNKSYEVREMEYAEENHDWDYAMKIQFYGTKNKSRHLNITKQQFNKIKKIF